MAEILWHRRETRRQTENTNFSLHDRATSRLYYAPLGGDNQEHPAAPSHRWYRIATSTCAQSFRLGERGEIVL